MPEYAVCDMCGRRLRWAAFFCVSDKTHGRGFCKKCIRDMFPNDEDDDLEFFALTARYFRKKLVSPKHPVPVRKPYEQLSLFEKKDGQ